MNITVLGLGAMGLRIAENLIEQNFKVTVWNRSPERARPLQTIGASIANTPLEAAENADIVLSMVRDDVASRTVWLDPDIGALKGLSDQAIGIESSTVSIAWIKKLEKAFAKNNKAFLDAPVVGSRHQADSANLIYLVGGESKYFARANVLFSKLGSAIYHTGGIGSGMTLKLLVNAMLGVQVSLLAELIGAASRQGLVPNHVVDILGAMPSCSPAGKVAMDNMVSGKFEPQFPVELAEKDLAYLVAMGANQSLPLSTAACEVFRRAISEGYGGENITALAKLY